MIKIDPSAPFRVNGRAIARKILEKLKQQPPPNKILAAIFVGESAASETFLKIKEKFAAELGVEFQLYRLPETVSQAELEDQVKKISYDPSVGGVVVQLPLPKNFDRERVLANLTPLTDVDALTTDQLVQPPTVGVVQEILKEVDWDLKNKTVAVVGRGLLVGGPIIRWLEGERIKNHDLRIKVADIKTKDLEEFLKDADLVISGVGKVRLIKPEWLKPKAGVIDFGFPPDLDQGSLEIGNGKLGFYTPTPGGCGPILVAKLFENFYLLTKHSL